jgi:hypothetical protein
MRGRLATSAQDEITILAGDPSMGAAVILGESAAMLKNERGVILQLETKVKGIRFNIAASGVRIALSGHDACAANEQRKSNNG